MKKIHGYYCAVCARPFEYADLCINCHNEKPNESDNICQCECGLLYLNEGFAEQCDHDKELYLWTRNK